jgi:hypothetical protein
MATRRASSANSLTFNPKESRQDVRKKNKKLTP